MKTLRRTLLQLGCATLLTAGSAAATDDWGQFRGPERTGVSSETGLAANWPAGGPATVWSIGDLGEGYGSVAVVGERLYVQGTEGSDSLVFARSVADGSLLWKTKLGERLIQDKGNGPRGTPTVTGDTLYALSGSGDLAALATADGSVQWQFNILERFGVDNIRWGVSESPLVDGDRLYIMPGGSKGAIAALDRATGDTVWTSKGLRDRMSYSSLVLQDIGGIRTILGFTQEGGVGIRASDGELLWKYASPANRTANAAAPVYHDGLVFYTSAYGTGGGALRVEASGDEIESSEAWFKTNLQNHHGGVVQKDGYLYGFFGPALSCVDLATGEIRWRARSVGKGSVAIVGDKLVLLGERHKVGLADASPEAYREGGQFEIADHGWPSWAYPVVANGKLFVRNWNELTVYDVSANGAASSGAGR
ncbi:MAG: PQQ-binding-like beta-propeller repeat protein [Acidobacteriota bacterium]